MATGFPQRFKGKIAADQLWLGGSAMVGPSAAVAYSTAGSQTLGKEAVSNINASSGKSVFTLGFDPVPGMEKLIKLTAVSSGVQIKAKTGTFIDTTSLTVLTSTYAPQAITLVGQSTLLWLIKSVYPGSTGGVAPAAGVTGSATT